MPVSCSAAAQRSSRRSLARRRRLEVVEQRQGDRLDALGLLGVDLEAPLQLAHRRLADVAARDRGAALELRRAARSKITPWRSAPRAGCSASMPKFIARV